jgi:hypothetical protein
MEGMVRSLRVAALAVILPLIFSTSACTQDNGLPHETTAATTSVPSTAVPDPASEVIPLDGDAYVSIVWSTDGVDLADPAVIVARRYLALQILAANSSDWADLPLLLSALDSVSEGDSKAKSLYELYAKSKDRKLLPGPLRVMLSPPLIQADSVVVESCLAMNEAFPAPAGSGFDDDTAYRIQILTLSDVDGMWKVVKRESGFADDPDIDPKLDKRCAEYTVG